MLSPTTVAPVIIITIIIIIIHATDLSISFILFYYKIVFGLFE
jgi:hypothetical protein